MNNSESDSIMRKAHKVAQNAEQLAPAPKRDNWDTILIERLGDLEASFEDLRDNNWADVKDKEEIAGLLEAALKAGEEALTVFRGEVAD